MDFRPSLVLHSTGARAHLAFPSSPSRPDKKISKSIAFGMLVSVALTAWLPSAQAHHVGEEVALDEAAVVSTNQLLALVRQYERTPAPLRGALTEQLTQLAAQRRAQLIMLIEQNPRIAALRMLPQSVAARLPAAAKAYIEQPVILRGSVSATVGDDFQRGKSHTSLQFKSENSTERLEFRVAQASDRELLGWVGKRGAVHAMRLGSHLLVVDKRTLQLAQAGGSTGTQGATASASTGPIEGVQNTLVVMVNFSDKPLACTAGDLQTRLFGSTGQTMNVGYQQSSGNRVSFSGNVIGPVTINYASTDVCNHAAWTTAADAAAVAAGANPANYLRVTYAMPANASCGWSGLATLGGEAPTRSWVQSCSDTGVFSHELGHNLLFNHAATPTFEYGDASDPMGGAKLVQSNAAHRVMAGWLDPGRIQDVAVGGSYAITALESTGATMPQVLRFAKPDTAETYYVSLRQPIDLDTALPAIFHSTLSLHRSTGTLPAKTVLLSNLAAGQSWTDSVNGIQIRNDGVSGATASVSVAFGGGTCARLAPGVSVSPASQSGAAGATLGYALTIQNNNSAACPSSVFNLTQALPSGFAGSLATSSVTLASGASTNVGWNVASATASTDASYTLTASATDSAVTGTTQVHAAYVVSNPPPPPPPPPPPTGDTVAPTLTITSPAGGATLSARGSTTISANASDNVGVASVQFYVDGTLLSTSTSAPYSATWNLRKVTRGAHSISVRALDAAGNATQKSLSVTVK